MRWRCDRLRGAQAGSSLLEALVALSLLAAMMSGAAQLLLWSRRTAADSGASTIAVTLASQKLQQLRGLTWAFDADGRPLSDETSDASTDPPSRGGSGLGPSPPGTLDRDTRGYAEYLDERGVWCGNGGSPPPGAVFVRRWAIEAFASDPDDTRVLRVAVLPLRDVAAGERSLRAAVTASVLTRGVR